MEVRSEAGNIRPLRTLPQEVCQVTSGDMRDPSALIEHLEATLSETTGPKERKELIKRLKFLRHAQRLQDMRDLKLQIESDES